MHISYIKLGKIHNSEYDPFMPFNDKTYRFSYVKIYVVLMGTGYDWITNTNTTHWQELLSLHFQIAKKMYYKWEHNAQCMNEDVSLRFCNWSSWVPMSIAIVMQLLHHFGKSVLFFHMGNCSKKKHMGWKYFLWHHSKRTTCHHVKRGSSLILFGR